MRKILAKNEDDFFKIYLKANESDDGKLYDEMDYYVEEFKTMKKPKEYPCIILYYHYIYNFIYKSDFDGFEPIGFNEIK